MKTTEYYVVQSPIYGYNGMGYENKNHLVKRFDSEAKAIKWAKRCNKTLSPPSQKSESWDLFYREMTDNISFRFKEISKVFKEKIVWDNIDYA